MHYAKAGPDDLLMSIQVTNQGPEAETIHVLPTAWFRNTWSWGDDEPRPGLRASGDRSVTIDHPFLGTLELIAAAGPGGAEPQLLFCENETNLARLYGAEPVTPYPKDGINDHVIARRGHGQPGRHRDQVRVLVPGHGASRGRPPSCGCGCGRPPAGRARPRPRRRPRWARTSIR